MTFQNLLKIGQLKVHSASAVDVQKLLAVLVLFLLICAFLRSERALGS